MASLPISDDEYGFNSLDEFLQAFDSIDDESVGPASMVMIPLQDKCSYDCYLDNKCYTPPLCTEEKFQVMKPISQMTFSNTKFVKQENSYNTYHPPTNIRSESTSSVVNSPPLSPILLDVIISEEEEARMSVLQDHSFTKENRVTSFFPFLQSGYEKSYQYDPKPLMKKNSRKLVPAEEKNQKYWQKRLRNNKAARKSREDRRKKELEVLDTMKQLKDENAGLKLYINSMNKANEQMQQEIATMKQKLEVAGLLAPQYK